MVPREHEIVEKDAVPDDLRSAAANLGLFGYAIPQEWGGLGLNLMQDVQLAMEFGYTCLSLRSLFGTNNGIAGQVLVNYGSDDQRQEWLGRLASGEVIASFALTEPGAGSNPAGLKTTARRDGDDWIIDGAKQYITNAPMAGLFITFAPHHAAGRGHRPGHRGLPGTGRHARHRGRPARPQDGPGGRVDGQRDVHRGARSAARARRRGRGRGLPGGDGIAGPRAHPHRRPRGRRRPPGPRRIGHLRRLRDAGRHAPSAIFSSSRPTSPTCRPA